MAIIILRVNRNGNNVWNLFPPKTYFTQNIFLFFPFIRKLNVFVIYLNLKLLYNRWVMPNTYFA